MARAYSLDLRERAVAAVGQGLSCREAADCFGISVASVVKWTQRVRQTGSAAPKKVGGHRPYLLADHRDWLLARRREKPDLTLHALLAELEVRGIVVSCDTLWRFLVRERVSFKKTVFASLQDRPDVVRRRALEANAGLARSDPPRLHRA